MATFLGKPLRTVSRGRNFSTSAFKGLAQYPATQITTLPNGIRVATESLPGESATVGVFVDAGSRYETQKTNGVAHFLEHLFFKGTPTRSRRALEVEVENLGGQLNAYTAREQTVFNARVLREHVPKAMDILADMIQNSVLDESSIENERSVILRESEEIEKQLEEVIFDRLHETAYRNCSLGYTILGPEKNINTISRADVKDYHSSFYVGSRMVIAGSGAVEHKQLVELATKLFANIKPNAHVVKEPASFIGSDIRVRMDSMPQLHIAYAFPVAGYTDPDSLNLLVIQNLLGTWSKKSHGGVHHPSKLISEVVGQGLAHSITPFTTQYSDTGLFGVYTVSDAVGAEDLMYHVTRALTNVAFNVDNNDLAAAKNALKLTILSQLDSSNSVCDEVGRQLLTYGRRIHPLEALARVDAVDANAIKATAKRFFYDRDFALAAVGPTWELPDYNWLRRRTYFLAY